MSIRKTNTAQWLQIPTEMQQLLQRNGLQAQIVEGEQGWQLLVKGHDSPLLTYALNDRQLSALTDWGTNAANRKCYNTLCSIIAADFDMPKDFVHARNANGRVMMGLHGYRLGWMPRAQDGYHLRRIGGQLYYADAIVPERANGRLKPGELQSGGYGFYYRPTSTAQVAGTDVLQELQEVLQPVKRERPLEAKPYGELITSDVYFTNEKWQQVLASHGLLVDAEGKTLTVQSSKVEADMSYDLTAEELAKLTNNSLKEVPLQERLDVVNGIIQADYDGVVTKELLNGNQPLALDLLPAVKQELNNKLGVRNEELGQSRDSACRVENRNDVGMHHGASAECTAQPKEKHLGTKIGAALMAGLTVAGEIGHAMHHHCAPDIYVEQHGGERVYHKPGVDSPQDVAARRFDAAVNAELRHELKHGL